MQYKQRKCNLKVYFFSSIVIAFFYFLVIPKKTLFNVFLDIMLLPYFIFIRIYIYIFITNNQIIN